MPMFVLKNIWPSCSSIMYPCDFWLWGVFREKTNAAIHGIIDPLKTSIRKPLKSNMPEEARVTCAAFSGQFDRMNVVYWGYIEWNVTSGTLECTYKTSARYHWNWRWYGTRKNDTERSRFICPPRPCKGTRRESEYERPPPDCALGSGSLTYPELHIRPFDNRSPIFFSHLRRGLLTPFTGGLLLLLRATAMRESPPRTWLAQPETTARRPDGTGNWSRVLPIHGLMCYRLR